ncbi:MULTISPECIES: class I SAM-dependent methyltransferase [unclassified Streptomyces]|uniref:class I SAM-dependent methyltransferase n=1 Tax=unclassified Streptomyces TaxID=2593676 RepID=UPI002E17BE87|nr:MULTISPECIES: class I SAM-dependent methyltransferase [unclassified Streptomyces]
MSTQPPPAPAPDNTAERCALWRAMHVQVDEAPHVLEDEVGLRLLAPAPDWRERPDMEPTATRGFRAAMVSRARFIEDLVERESERGVDQYVILGAGLDTLAQRRPELAARLDIYEVDQPGPQSWKRARLEALGYGVPPRLHLVPVDFEARESWWDGLTAAGFDPRRPALVVSTGVAMYLTREATAATLEQIAKLAPGSTLALSFILPADLLDEADRSGMETSKKGASASGTPFLSFYAPEDMLTLAHEAGFATTHHVPGRELATRYFTARDDALRPSSGEDFLVATT